MLQSIRWQLQRAARGAWWLVTPWRMKQRLRFVRERRQLRAEEEAVARIFERERLRIVTTDQRHEIQKLGLYDLQDIVRKLRLESEDISWPSVQPNAIVNPSTAARFCIDLIRTREDLRSRFPDALSGGVKSAFFRWISGEGSEELGLPAPARDRITTLLSGDFAARARQAFLTDDDIRAVLPHGLTPIGQPSLFEWFIRRGLKINQLSIEEVWWLFLQATEDPVRELQEAFRFTPDWQQLFPDGLTVFGCDQFVTWFSQTYGGIADWIDLSKWPLPNDAAEDLRVGYFARAAWREAWPNALRDPLQARQWIEWLRSPASSISERAKRWCESLDAERIAVELTTPGANLLGHFCYPSGLQVSVRSLAGALAVNKVRLSLRDVRVDARDEPQHVRFDGLEVHDMTILHVQPEPHFRRAYERAGLAPRSPRTYRIAYWYWEFESVPQEWSDFAEHVDEIWTATEFIARGLRERFCQPIRTLMPGVSLAPYTKRALGDFGLDASRYTFLFTFNMMSVVERKNPLGLIRAFQRAFREDEPVSLVIKSSFGDRHPEQLQQLRDAAKGASIKIIDQLYSSDEILSLMDACDAYVSLHRSEGLGLTMAEAMLMGKPVIATRHSGNVDFMNDGNSLLVDCDLIPLGRDIPPYSAKLKWANPSEAHAAQLMRRLYDDQPGARRLGQAALQSAVASLSPEAAGLRVAQRLDEIRRVRSGFSAPNAPSAGPLFDCTKNQ
ncbi:glycosyltransferase family 4 protein [Variovorax sp. tm]|uniref:glycosyltransferase family 4 protein n=1 Tax=Variovorax atrisoli TaxID=3394203 RepID=UPI003A812BB1